MSCRHRYFSVQPAREANTCGDDFVSSRSHDGHRQRSPALDIGVGAPAPQLGYRARRKHWIRAAGEVPATVPMWSSRSDRIPDITTWEASASGGEACRAAPTEGAPRCHQLLLLHRRALLGLTADDVRAVRCVPHTLWSAVRFDDPPRPAAARVAAMAVRFIAEITSGSASAERLPC